MKKHITLLLLLIVITATAHADNNAKPNKVKQPAQSQQSQTVTPANNPATNDTAWHGTGTHYDFGERHYDARTARYGYVDIDSATAVKYGCTRPTMPVRSSTPYQFTDSKAVKLDK